MTKLRSRESDLRHVKEEAAKWRREKEAAVRAAEVAIGVTGAVFGTDNAGRRGLAIKSGEMNVPRQNLYRVTFFGPDGPQGHQTGDTDREIAEHLEQHFKKRTIEPASEDEVLEFTTTEEFVNGSKIVAIVQADNMLRYMAGKLGRYEWASNLAVRARKLTDAGDLDGALAIMTAALRELPIPNPRRGRRYALNPAWVTSAIADHYAFFDDHVEPKWHPQLANVQAGPGESLVAKLQEYGCGAYGCVIATLDPSTVLKVTSDQTEAEFAAKLSTDLAAPVCVEYRKVVSISTMRQGRPVYLLWRESANDVGKLPEVLGESARNLVDVQHAAAQNAYRALVELTEPANVIADRIDMWVDACQQMADQNEVPELKALGAGMVKIYSEQRILFGDIHTGNLGRVTRPDGDSWVITDPGHIAVLDAEFVVPRRNPPGQDTAAWVVMDAARRAPRWLSSSKVFISDVYDQVVADGRDDGMSPEEFKREVVKLARAGQLELARADLVAAMPRHKVRASEISSGGADYHFVRVPS